MKPTPRDETYAGVPGPCDHIHLNQKRAKVGREEWVKFLEIQADFLKSIRDRRAKPHRVDDLELLGGG